MCWIDFSDLGKSGEALENYLLEQALFHIDPGSHYGRDYGTYARMNLACPETQLKQAMERLASVFGNYS